MPIYCSCTCYPPAVAGMILRNRVCPSFPPDICLSVFFEFDHYISLNFANGARNPYEVVHNNPNFLKNFFKNNGTKIGFLNLKKNLVINFYLICSIMNIFIICCVPTQILYLVKILFLRCRSK